ncbi:MAG: 5-formyltetrahydrofolate cyclo-ligase [Bacillales bacterium]|jgi:5-formyltetrahydrofolate cyclo-ligase|nr:5-formyltetrahydrofolate cyclo-ligase [Bacillales bacterium]
MLKNELRSFILNELKNLSRDFKNHNTKIIHSKLFATEIWCNSKNISITLSTELEIDTYAIIRKAWDQGKSVSVPAIDVPTKSMTFYRINSFDNLKITKFGIKEPADNNEVSSIENFDLVIVPGVYFNKRKYRIGYGGGYYDRFLPKVKAAKISLAYDFQVAETFIEDSYDYPVDLIITEVNEYC